MRKRVYKATAINQVNWKRLSNLVLGAYTAEKDHSNRSIEITLSDSLIRRSEATYFFCASLEAGCQKIFFVADARRAS